MKDVPERMSGAGPHKVVKFTDKWGQSYTVSQMGPRDFDPYMPLALRTRAGEIRNTTNMELMKKGQAPYTRARARVELHHRHKNSAGPLVWLSQASHRRQNDHTLMGGLRMKHPHNPVDRRHFDKVRQQYWREFSRMVEKSEGFW